MNYVIFEEEYPNPLAPLTLLTPSHELYYGFKRIVEEIKAELGTPLGYKLPSRFRGTIAGFLDDFGDAELAINGSIRPSSLQLIKNLRPGQALYQAGRLVSARGNLSLIKDFERLETHGLLIDGPWELVGALETSKNGPANGVEIGRGVKIEEPVSISAEGGGVKIGDDVRIEAFSRIVGPVIIGKGTVIRSARVNSNTVIGENCRVGGEVDSTIIGNYTNKAHFGYIGHSYVGNFVNVGAGSTVSDLKNTYGTIRARGKSYDTGMIKLGAFIADHVRVSINTSLFGGVSIGAASHVEGAVRSDVAPFRFVDGSIMDIYKLLEIVDRMKRRRNLSLTAGERLLLMEAAKLAHASS